MNDEKKDRAKSWYIYPTPEIEKTLAAWMKANKVKSINRAVVVLLSEALELTDGDDLSVFDRLGNLESFKARVERWARGQGIEL